MLIRIRVRPRARSDLTMAILLFVEFWQLIGCQNTVIMANALGAAFLIDPN